MIASSNACRDSLPSATPLVFVEAIVPAGDPIAIDVIAPPFKPQQPQWSSRQSSVAQLEPQPENDVANVRQLLDHVDVLHNVAFAGADVIAFFNVRHEHTTVADFSGSRGGDD